MTTAEMLSLRFPCLHTQLPGCGEELKLGGKNSFVSFYSILCIIYNLLSSSVAKDLSGDNSRPSPTLVLATTPKLYTVKGAAE